jgi:hypothetical protein
MICSVQAALRVGTSVSATTSTGRTSVLKIPWDPAPAFVAFIVQTTEAFDIHD